jgi:hypothetical protein
VTGHDVTSHDTAAGLRAWAHGVFPLEAAVELLIRYQGGRFTDPSWPWIDVDDSQWSVLVAEQLTSRRTGVLSGGERRILAVAASLAGGAPVDLADTVSGVDRHAVELILAAISHASGSHQHSDIPSTTTAGSRPCTASCRPCTHGPTGRRPCHDPVPSRAGAVADSAMS